MLSIVGATRPSSWPSMARPASSLGRPHLERFDARRGDGRRLAQRAGQRLEQRPVGVQGVGRERRAVDRDHLDGPASDGRVQSRGLLHVSLGHLPQLRDLEPNGRIDVGLGLAFGGVAVCASCRAASHWMILVLQHPRQVAQERDAAERVGRLWIHEAIYAGG